MLKRPFRARSALLALLLAQIIVAAVAGGRAWAGRSDDPELPEAMQEASRAQLPLTVESGVAVAQNQAATWLSHAYLLNVNMEIDWPSDSPNETVTTLPPGGWLTVTYVAPWNRAGTEAATLSMLFERGSGQLLGQWQTKWPKAPAPRIAMPNAGVDSTTAVLAAELAGGTSFRAECPRERSRTRISLTTEPDPDNGGAPKLAWLINYTDSCNQILGYRVYVDVVSGKLFRVENDPVDCTS